MVKNYIKIAWRNLVKNKGYSVVSTLGLAFGVACCILVGLYVYHELSYESHHKKSERIFRIIQYEEHSGNVSPTLDSPSLENLMKTFQEQLAEVSRTTRLLKAENAVVKHNQVSAFEDAVFFADSSVVDMFTITFLNGDSQTALSRPGTVIISKTMADKYFGEENPMGKTLLLTDEEMPFLVTGIIENPPSSTELPFHFIANRDKQEFPFGSVRPSNYVLLKLGADVKHVENMMLKLAKANARIIGLKNYTLQRLDKTHHGIYGDGDMRYIYIFSFVALFLLVIANINHINLSIAQFIPRSREVGIRKTLGARKFQLSFQYLTETFLLSLVSILFALFLVEFAYPWVNSLPDISLAPFSLTDPLIWGALLLLALVITLLSGSYITFYLARLKPASIFQKGGTQSSQSSYLQKGLVIFQFAASITLICSTLIVQDQLNFMMDSRLGFDKEQVLVLDLDKGTEDQYQVLKDKIEGLSQVKEASGSSGTIGSLRGRTLSLKGLDNNFSMSRLKTAPVERGFFSTMEIEKLSGDFKNLREGHWVLNASAAEKLNISEAREQPLPQIIGAGGYGDELQGTIQGIVQDFHYESLHEKIQPLFMKIGSGPFESLHIRLQAGAVGTGLDQIRNIWNEVVPSVPIQYSFLDNRIEQMYRTDRRFAQIFWGFSIITIVIACMGLFGLSSLMAKRRQKEIGIRKVLGATVTGVVALLSKDFVKLVVLGFVIALPIAWYAMNRWLADFAYRIELGPGIFALAGGIALLIALATVSWQSLRAALINPAETLRSE